MPYPLRLVFDGQQPWDATAAQIEEGSIPEVPVPQLEDVTSDGADYALHRNRGLRFLPFTARCLFVCTDPYAARTFATWALLAKGREGVMYSALNGVQRTYSIYCSDLGVPQILPGAVVSALTTPGTGVRVRFALELTKAP
jgi:hypothetical protein